MKKYSLINTVISFSLLPLLLLLLLLLLLILLLLLLLLNAYFEEA